MRRLYYCDNHTFELPQGHKFPVAKYRMVRDRLEATGLFQLEPAPFAGVSDIVLAHDAGYCRRFLEGTLDRAAMRRIGFPWSEGLVARTLASVGGTVAAGEAALATGWCGNLAGGTHHAFRGEGSGFCVFNDMAVAVQALRARGLARRAAILDLDVHQGDGTAEIFAADEDVLTVSMHGEKNFPFRKRLSRIDIALPDGTADVEYLALLEPLLAQVVGFQPDIVFFQSGVDALASDTLGRLSLSMQGLAQRDRMVFSAMCSASVPLVIVLGGGYSRPIERTAEAHAQTFVAAAELLSPVVNGSAR